MNGNGANPSVQTRALTRRFSGTVAVDSLDLDIGRGKIIGLLGANGAGKSTLLRHIIGLYLPDSGSCVTLGCDAGALTPAHLARIGYVHQEGELIEWMTVRQLVRYVSAYYPGWNADLEAKFAADFEIPRKTRIGAMSPGQRQRLAILLAIGFEPELLILDEPAAALDPIARTRFLDLLMDFIQDDTRTIIISSHILSDVEKIIDHVLIMAEGRMLCDSGFDELQERYCRLRICSTAASLPEELPFTDVLECQRAGAEALLTLRTPPAEALARVERELNCQIEMTQLPLEDLYRAVVSAN